MINKVLAGFREAVADIPDNATIMIGGFGHAADKPQNLTRGDPDCEPLQSVTCGGAKRLVSLNADYVSLAPVRNKYFYRATTTRCSPPSDLKAPTSLGWPPPPG